ncbi:Isochorismatase [Paramixta manurensis]|uniref:Isochorismatase n=1 Tax=Paramixta manurensis TaxID=2740817 RepID=A0A6M8U764_9GAMM|nr:Isochorismatase [Erwiniaceae bacterium PD-1]
MPAALVLLNLIEDLAGGKGRANYSHQQVVARNIIEKVNVTAAYARVRKIPIIWSRVGFDDDYQDLPAGSPLFAQLKLIGALRRSTTGCHWLDGLEVQSTDTQFYHQGLSGFAGNNLLGWLQQHQRHHLLIGGVSSGLTIESTVREAHDRGLQVTVLEDLCAAENDLIHQQSMQTLQRIADISSTRQWMNR